MKISFLVPSTTNKRDWKSAEETHLWKILCQSLEDNTPDHQIKIFVGYDSDDRIYSIAEERLKFSAVFTKFKIEWFPMYDLKGELSQIWNKLGEEAIKQDYKYFKNLEFLIIDCLWYNFHPSHFNLEKSLYFIKKFKPRKAILTNLSPVLDYKKLKNKLPKNVIPAHDGLTLTL